MLFINFTMHVADYDHSRICLLKVVKFGPETAKQWE